MWIFQARFREKFREYPLSIRVLLLVTHNLPSLDMISTQHYTAHRRKCSFISTCSIDQQMILGAALYFYSHRQYLELCCYQPLSLPLLMLWSLPVIAPTAFRTTDTQHFYFFNRFVTPSTLIKLLSVVKVSCSNTHSAPEYVINSLVCIIWPMNMLWI